MPVSLTLGDAAALSFTPILPRTTGRSASSVSIKETSYSLSSLSPRLQREGLEECPPVRFRNRFIKWRGTGRKGESPTLNALSPGLNPSC